MILNIQSLQMGKQCEHMNTLLFVMMTPNIRSQELQVSLLRNRNHRYFIISFFNFRNHESKSIRHGAYLWVIFESYTVILNLVAGEGIIWKMRTQSTRREREERKKSSEFHHKTVHEKKIRFFFSLKKKLNHWFIVFLIRCGAKWDLNTKITN